MTDCMIAHCSAFVVWPPLAMHLEQGYADWDLRMIGCLKQTFLRVQWDSYTRSDKCTCIAFLFLSVYVVVQFCKKWKPDMFFLSHQWPAEECLPAVVIPPSTWIASPGARGEREWRSANTGYLWAWESRMIIFCWASCSIRVTVPDMYPCSHFSS